VKSRARGCLIAAAVALALATTAAGVLGPGLFRKAREVYAPIQKMRSAQEDFAAWSKQQGWHEPAEPTLDAAHLDRFLALRKELQHLEEDAPRRRVPRDRRPTFRDMPVIVGGVSTFVSARLEAFKRSGMTNEEYRYLEHLVYRTWLAALREAGQDPAAKERAAEEILSAARDEPDSATAAHLRAAAQRVRERRPGPPAGVPPDVHSLLLGRANDIEALSDPSPPGLPRGRE
jgi:hypothetical protein